MTEQVQTLLGSNESVSVKLILVYCVDFCSVFVLNKKYINATGFGSILNVNINTFNNAPG